MFAGQGKRRAPVSLGWPEPGTAQRIAPVRKAQQLFSLYEAFHNANFPEFETGKLYTALDFRSDLTMEERSDRLRRLAVRHAEDPDAVAAGIFGNVGPASRAGLGSLFNRARWYYDNPDEQAEAFKDHRKPAKLPTKPFDARGNALPRQEPRRLGLRRPASRLARAWQAAHASAMSCGDVRPWLPALVIVEITVTRLANTGTIERWFKQVSLLELKARARLLGPRLLHEVLKVRVQDVWGVRPASEFRARSLLVREGPGVGQEGHQITWPMTAFAKLATGAYVDFWGKRRLASRELEHKSTKPHSRGRKHQLRFPRRGCLATLKGKKREHANAVQAAILARDSGKTEGVLGPVPDRKDDRGDGKAEATERSDKKEKKVDEKREKDKHKEKKDKKDKKAKDAKKEKKDKKGKKDKKAKKEEEDKKGKTNAIAVQKKVLAVKARMHAIAKPGLPVPYVDAKGGLMHQVSAGEQRRRDSEAAQAARDKVTSSAKRRKIYGGPGASLVPSTRFEVVGHFKDADVVVVDNLASRTRDDASLCASLWGKALCDNEWVRSGGTHGTCFKYAGFGSQALQMYLSDAFQKERPVLSEHLHSASAKHDKRNIRGPDGKIVKKRMFRVIGGAAPDVGPVAVRTLFVVSEAELKTERAKKRKSVVPVSVEGLALELGAGAARL